MLFARPLRTESAPPSLATSPALAVSHILNSKLSILTLLSNVWNFHFLNFTGSLYFPTCICLFVCSTVCMFISVSVSVFYVSVYLSVSVSPALLTYCSALMSLVCVCESVCRASGLNIKGVSWSYQPLFNISHYLPLRYLTHISVLPQYLTQPQYYLSTISPRLRQSYNTLHITHTLITHTQEKIQWEVQMNGDSANR